MAVMIPGTLKLVDTIETFKAMDKMSFFGDIAHRVSTFFPSTRRTSVWTPISLFISLNCSY
jgi:hypothetical protein